jgi:hypothetical protein
MTGEELAAMVRGLTPVLRELITREVSPLMTRLAVLEAMPTGRDGRDGQPGRDGAPGPPGAHGTHGVDGLGFDDFDEQYDGDRTIVHRYRQGDRVKEFRHKMAIALYRGVWQDGRTYERGDSVTWAGSEWHCHVDATAAKPGDGSKVWTLKVKRGRDGRDGRDGGSS